MSDVRFAFGRNWQRFLAVLDEDRIKEAERSLRGALQVETLAGLDFLDVGCGSGLFSLAAMNLGADRVYSFDYDSESAGCARELRRRYYPEASHWTVETGSALDAEYLRGLGRWRVVYSWGVLHHTGRMWDALTNVADLVTPGGQLCISIYNDQGVVSTRWRQIKRLYNSKRIFKRVIPAVFIPYFVIRGLLADLLRYRRNPFARYRERRRDRGMSVVHDWLDWLGGYPFEVAKPEEIFNLFYGRGFDLVHLKTCGGGLGCNEFLFRRRIEVPKSSDSLTT